MARWLVTCVCRVGSGQFGHIRLIHAVPEADGPSAGPSAGEVFTVQEVAQRIHAGMDEFAVSSASSVLGGTITPEVRARVHTGISHAHHEFIQTVADHIGADNLLALPTCHGCEALQPREGHDDEDSGNADPSSDPPADDGGGADDASAGAESGTG